MLTAYRRVFGNPWLARLMAGEFISSIGDWLYMVGMLIVVYDQSDDPLALGLVGAARIAPYVLFSVPAGIVADRFDRRTILLTTDIVRGGLQVVLAILVLNAAPTVWIVAVAMVATSVAVFFGPAIGAYLPSLVDDEADLGPANSVWATLDNLAYFIGPAVAGLLIAAGGLVASFILNAASFAVVAVILATLPAKRTTTSPTERDSRSAGERSGAQANGPSSAAGGWATIVGRMPAVMLLDAATSFVGGGLGVLTVIVAVDLLGVGEAGTGYLNAAIGVGGIAAGIVAGWVVLRRLDVGIVVGSLICGAGLIALSLAADLLLASVAIAIAAGAQLVLDVINATLLQRTVPDGERGRAMGVLQIFERPDRDRRRIRGPAPRRCLRRPGGAGDDRGYRDGRRGGLGGMAALCSRHPAHRIRAAHPGDPSGQRLWRPASGQARGGREGPRPGRCRPGRDHHRGGRRRGSLLLRRSRDVQGLATSRRWRSDRPAVVGSG